MQRRGSIPDMLRRLRKAFAAIIRLSVERLFGYGLSCDGSYPDVTKLRAARQTGCASERIGPDNRGCYEGEHTAQRQHPFRAAAPELQAMVRARRVRRQFDPKFCREREKAARAAWPRFQAHGENRNVPP